MSQNLVTPEWFWGRVGADSSDACWIWPAGKTADGYGRVRVAGSECKAHRLAWELSHGSIPPGLCVLHRCDNPPCCNPQHLFLGTHADNVADRVAKGRSATGDRNGARRYPPQGEKNGRAKLTESDVRAIRAWVASGFRPTQLAAEYGVSYFTVRRIITGERWPHTFAEVRLA